MVAGNPLGVKSVTMTELTAPPQVDLPIMIKNNNKACRACMGAQGGSSNIQHNVFEHEKYKSPACITCTLAGFGALCVSYDEMICQLLTHLLDQDPDWKL